MCPLVWFWGAGAFRGASVCLPVCMQSWILVFSRDGNGSSLSFSTPAWAQVPSTQSLISATVSQPWFPAFSHTTPSKTFLKANPISSLPVSLNYFGCLSLSTADFFPAKPLPAGTTNTSSKIQAASYLWVFAHAKNATSLLMHSILSLFYLSPTAYVHTLRHTCIYTRVSTHSRMPSLVVYLDLLYEVFPCLSSPP